MLPGCKIERNIDYEGHDIHHETADMRACRNLCASTEGCLFWTWKRENKCSLKDSDSGKRNYTGAYSGNKKCGISKNLISKLAHFTTDQRKISVGESHYR